MKHRAGFFFCKKSSIFPLGLSEKAIVLPQTNNTSRLIPSVQKPNYRITLKVTPNCENLQRYRSASWVKVSQARFKRRILHAPNRIAKLSACKMLRLNQLNATYFNSIRSSRICDWTSTVDLNAAFYMCRIELKLSSIIYVCSNGNLNHVTRAQQFYSAKQCDV